MAAIVFFSEDNGAAAGTPPKGTRTTGVTQMNWKNTDDVNTAYSSSPITAGNNSYDKFQFVVFSGSYNQISSVNWNHLSGVLGAGLTVKALVSGSGFYSTPSTAANANLVYDLTATGLVSTGLVCPVGGTGPEYTGKGSSTNAIPAYTPYLITQLQTTTAASPGDTTSTTWQVQYSEN